MRQRKTKLEWTTILWTIQTLIEKNNFSGQVSHLKVKITSISLGKMDIMDRNIMEHTVPEIMIV